MDFVNGLREYFTVILLDFSTIVSYIMYAIALLILDWPKKAARKDILYLAIKGVCVVVAYILFESLAFGVSGYLGSFNGMFFTATLAVIPAVYVCVFLKNKPIMKAVKIEIIIASFLTIGTITTSFADIMMGIPDNTSILRYVSRLLPTSFIIPIAYIIKRNDIDKFKHVARSQFILFSIMSISLCVSSIWQSTLNNTELPTRLLLFLMTVASLVILIQAYYTMYSAVEKRHRITTLEVQSSILQLEKDSLNIDAKNREELMKIRHDLNNQLSYINALLVEQKYEEAHQYLNGLLEQKEEYLESFSCPNSVISGIVNLELTKAKIANKKIKFRAVVPPLLPFEDSDLLSLITNIGDNCIENFAPENDKDSIMISIITQQDYLRITSFNTVDEKKMRHKFSLSTTKRGKNHGYGTKIIKNIAEKCNGYVTFSMDGNKFVCDCVLDMGYRREENA